MGGSSNETSNTIRYAPYLESAHQTLLTKTLAFANTASVNSPYANYTELSIEDAFFGAGYTISSFPSMYDMFGKFMAGLDIEILFNEAFEDTINGPVIDAIIADEAIKLSDDLENEASPRYELGMRDINAVMSSTFVVGKAMMEGARTKALSKFSSSFRASLLPVVTQRWSKHLDWNKEVIESYTSLIQAYITNRLELDKHNLDVASKDVLWPFEAFEGFRDAVGVLTGATSSKQKGGGSSAQSWIGTGVAAAGTIAIIV